MFGSSLYLLLPTADEILIHPAIGLFLAYTLDVSYVFWRVCFSCSLSRVGPMLFVCSFVFGRQTRLSATCEKTELAA
jgi:hypothetical protein